MAAHTSDSRHTSGDFSGSPFLISARGEMLKLPMPSPSPRDPLNWSRKRRAAVIACLAMFGAVSMFVVQVTSILYEPISQEFEQEESVTSTLVTTPTLLLGIGAFVWIPLSLALGRRPVFLLACSALTVGALVAASAQTFSALLVGLCIEGLATGFTLSLLLLVVIDMTYIDQRPGALAMIWSIPAVAPLTALSLTTVAKPYLSSWRIVFSICAALSAFILIFSIFFFSETFFIRPAIAYDGRILIQSSTEKVTIYEPWQYGKGDGNDYQEHSPEPLPKSPPSWTFWMEIRRPLGSSWKSMLSCYPQFLLCVCNPLIFWVVVMNAVSFGGMLSIGSTFAILATPPFSVPQQLLSLVNASAAIGALVSWPVTLGLGNPIVRALTIRAGGIRHAEHYLIFYLLPLLTGVVSLFLYGLAMENGWHFWTVCLAYGLNTFSSIGMGLANTLWITEAFPRWAASAIMAVGGFGYILSFAISISIPAWLNKEGFAKMNIEIGVLLLVIGLVAVPVAFWGKSLRQGINGKWSLYEGGALRPQQKRIEKKQEQECGPW